MTIQDEPHAKDAKKFTGFLPDSPNIFPTSDEGKYLDPVQLVKLELAFREWSNSARRPDVKLSRMRILLIFLLIRHTGARLNEVLQIDFINDIDAKNSSVRLGSGKSLEHDCERDVNIPMELVQEIISIEKSGLVSAPGKAFLKIDPGHVRRKFYERAKECGFHPELASPNAIRKSRAVELMQSNVPMPVVQRIMGQSNPSLTASFIGFADDEIRKAARFYMERDYKRKTSARNAFFGKISKIIIGDIQAQIEMTTLGGYRIISIITNNSLERLELRKDLLITAEIKAPWVTLHKSIDPPQSSAENVLKGKVTHIGRGKLTSEFIVEVEDGSQLCSVVTEVSRTRLALSIGDEVWILFSSSAVILHTQ